MIILHTCGSIQISKKVIYKDKSQKKIPSGDRIVVYNIIFRSKVCTQWKFISKFSIN